MDYIGIDVGTSMIKGQLLNDSGEILSSYEFSSPTYFANDCFYLSADKSKDIVLHIIKKLVADSKTKIKAISFSSLGESFALVDQNGKVLNDFMLFVSNLGQEETLEISQKLSNKEIAAISGLLPNRMFSFSKLMWFKKNHKDVYDRSYKFMMVSQYMVYILTNIIVCDYSLASRTMLFDIKNKTWSNKLIDACGLDIEKFPNLTTADSVVGTISNKIAKLTGLNKDCKVLAGGHDQMMAALGAGIIKTGMGNDGTGTAECLTVAMDKCPESYNFYQNNLCVVPYVVNDLYLTYAFVSTGGAMLKWYRNNILNIEYLKLKEKGLDFYQEFSSKEVNLPTNLLVLPHFDGSGTPYLDGESTGSILGLTQKTTKDEIYYSLMEAASFEIKTNINILKSNGIKVDNLTVSGGGSKSPSWNRIKANIYNIDIKTINSPDCGILGCFISCKKALDGSSYDEIIPSIVKVTNVYNKEQNLVDKYEKKFNKYKRIYSYTKRIWR